MHAAPAYSSMARRFLGAADVIFSDGRVNAVSWAADRPGGFSDADLRLFEEVLPTYSTIVEVKSLRRAAATESDTPKLAAQPCRSRSSVMAPRFTHWPLWATRIKSEYANNAGRASARDRVVQDGKRLGAFLAQKHNGLLGVALIVAISRQPTWPA